MADRRMWWGVGVLTMGIGAALLTGSATASADTGSDSGSTHSSSSATDHDTTKADSGADNDSSPRHSPKTTTADSTSGAASASATSTESVSSTTKADQGASDSTSTTAKADKPSGAKRPLNPQRVVQLRITKPDTEATPAATDADQPSTTTSKISEPTSEPSSSTPAVSTDEPSTPASPQVATSSSTDPTALPRGPTTLRSLAVVVDAPTTSTTVDEQSTTVDPAVTEPVAAPVVSEPITAPAQSEPVAALVSIDPLAAPAPEPTDAGAPTMRFAAMQTLADPTLFSSALPTSTLTTPFTPTVIQAPPTVGPIATAILDILASFGWRASPLAVWIAPSLYPWSAGAAVPTPIPAVQDTSGTPPPLTAPYVLVGHSTLDIPCGPTTYSARVDWYFPAQNADGTGVNPQGLIWVQNGFLANSGFYTALATNLSANTNSIVVVPTITSNPFSCFGCWLNGPSMQAGAASLFLGSRDALNRSAMLAGYQGTLPDPFILSGHSAGGGFAASTAGYTVANGASANLKGVVMFDGVPGFGVLSGVAPQLRAQGIPIYQIAAQNQIWNIWGLGTNELAASNPGGFNGVVIYHGSHVDSMLGGNPIVDFFAQLVTQFSPPGATQAVYTYADGWINDMYAGNAPFGPPYPAPSPLYPAPNQPVQVGPAKAYGLPSPTGQRSTLGEIIYGIITFFSSLFGA